MSGTYSVARASQRLVGSSGPTPKQQQKHVSRPAQHPYSVAPYRPASKPQESVCAEDVDPTVHPLQQQQLDDPLHWPKLQPDQDTASTPLAPASPLNDPPGLGHSSDRQQPYALQLTAAGPKPSVHPGNSPPWQTLKPHVGQVAPPQHRHPPIAPDDPAELLQVLQAMDHPRRRVVIFKGGGYVYADLEAMIEAAGLSHVMRLTNLMRKAHCIVAKERRDNGKHVNLSEHMAAARNAKIPFLLIERLEPELLVALLRPVLIQKRIVVEHPQRRAQLKAQQAADMEGVEAAQDDSLAQGLGPQLKAE